MNPNTKQWIRTIVGEQYRFEMLDIAIESLERFFDISQNDKSINWNVIYEDMMNSSDLEKRNHIKNFSDIERFLKSLSRIVYPGRLDTPPFPPKPNEKPPMWGLANIYRRLFHLVPKGIDLTNIDYEFLKKRDDYTYYYMKTYQFRNDQSHNDECDMSNLNEVIQACIITELSMCERYEREIHNEYNRIQFEKRFNRKTYKNNIINEYSLLEKNGFRYVDTMWSIEENNGSAMSITDLLGCNKHLLKLLGEPGTGKSTALVFLQYSLAKKMTNSVNYQIPVLIELKDCSNQDNVINNCVCKALGISLDDAMYLYDQGRCILLLDGYNEVLDLSIKKRIAHEIDKMSVKYENISIILSDRSSRGDNIPVLSKADSVTFMPLSNENVWDFIRTYSMSDECRRLIEEKYKSDIDYFGIFTTPLKLICLFDIVGTELQIPENYTEDYIRFVFERESIEKKDYNMEYLPFLLQAFAYVLNVEGVGDVPKIRALKIFKQCKDGLGFEDADTNRCLKLALDMKILDEVDNSRIRFMYDEYNVYFFLEGTINSIEAVFDE